MAFNILMRWDGVERRPMDGLLDGRLLDPEQCVHHRALWSGACVQVTQTWRTVEAHGRFLREVMGPAMAGAGVTQAPQVVVFAIPDLFLPRPRIDVPTPRPDSAQPSRPAAVDAAAR